MAYYRSRVLQYKMTSDNKDHIMAFDWRKLLGLNRTDDPSAGDGPHVRTVGGRSGDAVGDSIAGEYRVLDKFAGGMGFVYLVDRHDEDTPFVLKTLQRQEDDFLETGEVPPGGRDLAGARQAPQYRASAFRGYSDGQLFVAADYVPNTPDRGNSLQAYVGCTGVPEGLLLTWLAQFCHGMAHAQFHGVVAHRDIKPGNLMLMPDNELRITDFGLARSFTLPSGTIEDAVERRSISGTLPYMAPEQFLAPGALDHRVDIYAFGVTLYELIAGVRPFAEISQQVFVSQILSRAPKPLQSPLWAICERYISHQ